MEMNPLLYISFLLLLPRTTIGNKLAVIMMDGFRYDYADRIPSEDIPNLTKLMRTGVRAEYVRPVFPSMSHPCWVSISTGLYTESHGMLENTFWDEKEQEIMQILKKYYILKENVGRIRCKKDIKILT